MLKEYHISLSPEQANNDLSVAVALSGFESLDVNRIKKIETLKRSIDARQKQIKINLHLRVHIDVIEEDASINEFANINYQNVSDSPAVIIVGAGPAGLFAALRLLESGIKPIILERGKDVDSRRKDLALISRQQRVDNDSNYCFGEGGAGTFSDGKLFTRSKKKGPVEKILAILHSHGAPANILYESHAHIGTDRLPEIIKNIRKTIVSHGGEVHFNTKVTGFLYKNETSEGVDEPKEIVGVTTSDGGRFYGPVILATGHSARDTYRMIYKEGISMEPKGLAIGVRLEHPQELIDKIQYHTKGVRGKYLPPAEYSLLTRVDGRAVYSFCMCPGGIIVPSASGPCQSAVNGMSPSNRGSKWANSGIVVELLPDDVAGKSPLKMMEYQEDIENRFYDEADKTQRAPAQRMTDFIGGQPSTSLNPSSYAPGIFASRVDMLLPSAISSRLKKGMQEFGKKKRGFITDKATVIGAETRTSSPVRIIRDRETYCHPYIKGLYPAGEGAGWSGGIVSSAIDGQNAAASVALLFVKN